MEKLCVGAFCTLSVRALKKTAQELLTILFCFRLKELKEPNLILVPNREITTEKVFQPHGKQVLYNEIVNHIKKTNAEKVQAKAVLQRHNAEKQQEASGFKTQIKMAPRTTLKKLNSNLKRHFRPRWRNKKR